MSLDIVIWYFPYSKFKLNYKKGACDYFQYNGAEFYVNARMAHVQFCPVSSEHAVLKFPSMPDHGLTVTQVMSFSKKEKSV